MSDGLILTAYFGERNRVDGRLLADELLDIHARHEIRASILLRGVQGFGAKHRLRTDRLLTLSEDLPVVAMAVDAPHRIEATLDDMAGIGHEGLITLEHIRLDSEQLLNGGHAPSPPSASEGPRADATQAPHGNATRGLPEDAVKLTVYLGRHERIDGAPAFVTVCGLLHRSGVAGATVLLGVDGTRRGQRQRARFFARNKGVPLMVVAVGAAEAVRVAAKRLAETLPDPLLTVERVRVCKRDGALLAEPQRPPATDAGGLAYWQKLVVYAGERTRHGSGPLHNALVRRLRIENAAGATALRGVWGYHGEHRPHGESPWSIRRRVPILTVTLDRPANSRRWFEIVDEMTPHAGLVTSEIVPALRAAAPGVQHGGLELAGPAS